MPILSFKNTTKIAATGLALICSFGAVAAPKKATWYPVTYGSESNQKATFLPAEGGAKGLLVWIVGGLWGADTVPTRADVWARLATQGISVLRVEYRLGPKNTFPTPVGDIKTVLSGIHEGACDECEPRQMWSVIKDSAKKGIMLSGAEAGGYLAIYTGGDTLTYKPDIKLKCLAAIDAPLDLRKAQAYPDVTKKGIDGYAGRKASAYLYEEMSPAAHVYSGRWINLKTKWYFNFTNGHKAHPYELAKDMPMALAQAGYPVYQSMSALGEGRVAASAINESVLLTHAQHCFNIK